MSDNNEILKKILEQPISGSVLDFLVNEIPVTSLQSLLLEVFKRKSYQLEISQLFTNYIENRFVTPSDIDPREYLKFDQLAYSLLPDHIKPIELSPVAPIGNCSALATVDQNKVVSALRGLEVVSDSTNLLALECAIRRKSILLQNPKSDEQVNLASSHRNIRAQYVNIKNLTPHFKVFSLSSAGRDTGSLNFEISNIIEHITFYLDLIKSVIDLESVTKVIVKLTDFSKKHNQFLLEKIADPIKEKHRDVHFTLNNERITGENYYNDLCFHINIKNKNGFSFDYADGGITDWTQKLLSNNKERLLISAIGSELLLKTCTLKQ